VYISVITTAGERSTTPHLFRYFLETNKILFAMEIDLDFISDDFWQNL